MTTNILRRKDVEARVGLSRSTIYELMAANRFPKPVPLSRQRVGWLESEIADWQKARIDARDKVAA
ncbi:helix-turn-helix transcriptional regulator [Mesorhizobium australicum]|nr:AlpA family phage regulatory protein [Mesorhizobium australicum]